jgi:2-polyprenyl-3-methyl-5-hydroxy-6-metoxy-1,4-benzoquinol methylase
MRLTLLFLAGLCYAQQGGGENPAAIFDKIYASPAPPFNGEPSAFLARAIEGVTPGKALDIAMGQGRNSLYLARKGWDVTGYDVSSVGLATAEASAAKAGLKIHTVQKSHSDFDFGTAQWDLIAMVFPGTSMDDEDLLRRIKASLKPGGMIVVEQFNAPPVEGAKGPPNALFQTFQAFRVLRYEDVQDVSDWGRMKARIGRIAAVKE